MGPSISVVFSVSSSQRDRCCAGLARASSHRAAQPAEAIGEGLAGRTEPPALRRDSSLLRTETYNRAPAVPGAATGLPVWPANKLSQKCQAGNQSFYIRACL